jgi:alanyl aminopeptidase
MGNKSAAAVWPANEFSRETIRSALDVMDTDSLSTARAIRQPIKSTDDIYNAFDGLTYNKGAGVLAMFEAYLGEDAFREGVRTHMRRFAHASADVHDFMQSLAYGSGKPEIVPAFESFLNQPGVPLVRVKPTCSDRDLIVELSQSPAGAATAADKRKWSIPVCMRDVAKGRYRGCTMLTEQIARLTLPRACGATLMPNVDGAGYYRFSMAHADWQALANATTSLTPAEQLAMLHSLRAAFRAGDADAKTYLTALKAAATTGTWDTIALVRTFLSELRGNLLSEADRSRLEQTTRGWFAPALTGIGLDAGLREPRAVALMRAELAETLVKIGADPATTTALAIKGDVYLHDIAHGLHTAPLSPDLAAPSFWAAIRTGGAPVARDAVDAIKLSSDAEFRNLAIIALTATTDPAANREIEDFVASGSLRVREFSTYLRAAFADPDRRAGVWNWLRKDYKRISANIPPDSRARLVALAGNLCGDQSRAEIEWFYKPMIAGMPGAPRIYANVLETVDRCVGWRKAKGAEISAALSRQ